MYVMYIHLPDRYYDVNLLHLQSFVSVLMTKSSKFVHILFFSALFLDGMELLAWLHLPVYIV